MNVSFQQKRRRQSIMKSKYVVSIFSLFLVFPFSLPFCPNLKSRVKVLSTSSSHIAPSLFRFAQQRNEEHESVDQKLVRIAETLKLEIVDPKKGTYKLASKDQQYGLEVIKTTIQTEPSLGLELTEMGRSNGGIGLVLVSGMNGNSADAPIQIGDVVARVGAGKDYNERTVGLDYDGTVEVLLNAKQEASNNEDKGFITVEVERVVERAQIQIQVDTGDSNGGPILIDCRAGENLRGLLLRRGIKLGECGGQGSCGMCMVSVREGQDLLNSKEDLELQLTKGRPSNWRAACRTVVGASNQPGRVCIQGVAGE